MCPQFESGRSHHTTIPHSCGFFVWKYTSSWLVDNGNAMLRLTVMKKANPSALARKYLEFFDNDLEAALRELQNVAATERKAKGSNYKLTEDAPIVIDGQSISKSYKLGKQRVDALKDVSLTIRQGEFIAITGSSGSGKSTLLQLIGGLDKPSGGKLIIDGHDIQKLSDRKLSVFRGQTIGFVFQFFFLQPFLRLQTNLEVPAMFARTKRKDRRLKVSELASAVGLEDRLRHLPRELSGGQMQRAAIARALLNKPKLLLADEPTGNLDSANGKGIIDLFEQVRLNFGTTIVVVTHDSAIAARADREIRLKDGVLEP